jgi:hypothetical protein
MALYVTLPRDRVWQKRSGMPVGRVPGRTPRGQLYCWPFADPCYAELLKGGQPVAKGTTQNFASCPLGPGLKTLVDNTSQLVYNLSFPSLSTPYSMEVVGWLNTAFTTTNFCEIMMSIDDTNTLTQAQSDMAIVNNGTTKVQAGINENVSVGGGSFTANATAATVGYFHAVATWDTATLAIYYKGVQKSTVAVAAPMTNANGTKFMSFGACDGDASAGLTYLLANLATVAWSKSEVFGRFASPFGFLLYPEDLFVGRSTSGTTLTIDLGLALEFLASQRADGTVPDEFIASITGVDRLAQLEFLAAQQLNAPTVVEMLAGQKRDGFSQVEIIGTIAPSSPVNLESLGTASSDRPLYDEVLAGQRTDGPAQDESLATQRADRPVPAEFLGTGAVSIDGLVPLEVLASVNTDRAGPTEFLAGQRGDAAVPVEIIATARQDGGAPTESLVTQRTDRPVTTEVLGGVAADRPVPTEDIGTARSDAVVPAESLGGLIADNRVWAEWLATARRDGGAQLEFLATVQRDGPVPAEWSGLVSVTADGLVPLEFSSTMVAQATVAIENLASVTADRRLTGEFLLGVLKDGQANTETLGTIARDAPANIEFSRLVLIDQRAALELLGSVSADGRVNAEALSKTIADAGVPLENLVTTFSVAADGLILIEWGIAQFLIGLVRLTNEGLSGPGITGERLETAAVRGEGLQSPALAGEDLKTAGVSGEGLQSPGMTEEGLL